MGNECSIACLFSRRNRYSYDLWNNKCGICRGNFKNWENMLLIKTEHKNLNRGTYSAFLKQPQIYDNFSNFSHILIYQTDALLYRKIPDSYFKYDYIGSPWKLDNQCAKYPAGNGGFSLRNIKKVQDACSMFKNVKFPKIHRGNEDIFFCSQSNFEYPKFNSKFHKAFAIERVFYPTPVGSHQIWLTQMTVQNWKDFVKENIVEGLYKGNIKEHIVNEEDEDEDDKIKRIMDKSFEVEKEIILKTKTELKELLKVEQNVGPFLVEFVDLRQNKWEIVSSVKYDILFCKNEDPKSAVVVHNIGRQHCAVVHKKGPVVFISLEMNIYIWVLKDFQKEEGHMRIYKLRLGIHFLMRKAYLQMGSYI